MLSREEIRDECFSVFSQEIIQKYKRELTFYDARNDDRMDRTLLQMCDEYHCKKTIQSNTPTTPEANDWIDVSEHGLPSIEYDSTTIPVWDGKEVYELKYSFDGIQDNDTTGETYNGSCFYTTDQDYGGQYRVTNFTHYYLRKLPSPPKTTGEKS